MTEYFQLDPNYSIIYHSENTVEFRSGVWNVSSHIFNDDLKQGALAKIILEMEENKQCEIGNLTKTGIKKQTCLEIIAALKEKELLVTHNKPLNSSKNNFQSNLLLIGNDDISQLLFDILKKELPDKNIKTIDPIEISFIHECGDELFRDALVLEKIKEKCRTLFSDSILVSITNYINPLFYLFLNKIIYEINIPWFFSALDGPFVFVGPFFNGNFCYECLENRIFMNSKKSNEYQQYKKDLVSKKIRHGTPATDESLKHIACALTSMEILQYFNIGKNISAHKCLSLYVPTMEFSYHKILRLPGCRVCGIDNAFHGHQVHFDTGVLLTK